MIWAAEENFDAGSVCLVLTSQYFNEADYYREYDEYVAGKQDRGSAAARKARYSWRTIGIRHPVPNAREVTFRTGAACFRLNSAIRTSRSTRRTVASSKPCAMISSADCDCSTCSSRIWSSSS